ncbi:Hypothetical protein PHPALM_17252 [Phytophthora palmivora]|uniref:Uncharacterized protein n=1 Tax=Phytophthora palmivora TaxID=4796 RepID=A0A2P4XMN1_9STRA|nr:Hypothetical protein PHPALM_17252 [Phytophthora palmivora]
MPAQFLAILHQPRNHFGDRESELADDFYANDPKKCLNHTSPFMFCECSGKICQKRKIRDVYTRDSRHTRAGTPLSRNARSYFNICKQSESTHHHRSTGLPPRIHISPASECVPAYERKYLQVFISTAH